MLISFNKFCHSLINISVIQLTSTVLVQCCLVKQKHLQMYNCTSSNINHKKRQHFLILNQVSTTMEFKSRCSTNWTTCLMYMIPSKLFYPFSNTRLFLNYPWFFFFFVGCQIVIRREMYHPDWDSNSCDFLWAVLMFYHLSY